MFSPKHASIGREPALRFLFDPDDPDRQVVSRLLFYDWLRQSLLIEECGDVEEACRMNVWSGHDRLGFCVRED